MGSAAAKKEEIIRLSPRDWNWLLRQASQRLQLGAPRVEAPQQLV